MGEKLGESEGIGFRPDWFNRSRFTISAEEEHSRTLAMRAPI